VFAGERVDVMPATAVITLTGQAPSLPVAIPCNAVYYDGQVVYFDGEVVIYPVENGVLFDGTQVAFDGECVTYTT
jgi:hypothetical protein